MEKLLAYEIENLETIFGGKGKIIIEDDVLFVDYIIFEDYIVLYCRIKTIS